MADGHVCKSRCGRIDAGVTSARSCGCEWPDFSAAIGQSSEAHIGCLVVEGDGIYHGSVWREECDGFTIGRELKVYVELPIRRAIAIGPDDKIAIGRDAGAGWNGELGGICEIVGERIAAEIDRF